MGLQIDLLRSSFELVAPQADRLSERFYERLFADYPHLKPLFAGVDVPEQRRKLIQSLAVIVKSLDDLDTLTRFLHELGSRHADYGVAAEDYEPVALTLLAVLAEIAGDAWSDELAAAWGEALEAVATIMLEGAAQQTSKQEPMLVGSPAEAEKRFESNSSSVNGDSPASNNRATIAGAPAQHEEKKMSTQSTSANQAAGSTTPASAGGEQFYSMVEAAPIACLYADANSTVTYLNQKGQELIAQHVACFGVAPDELVGGPAARLWAQMPAVQSAWTALATPTNVRAEIKGEWFDINLAPAHNANGERIGTVATLNCVTKVVNAEEEVAELTGQAEAIGKSMAVIEFELDGTILTANDNFTATVGYSLAEIQGQHHRMFVEPEYSKSAGYTEFWQSLARGEYQAGEYKRLGKGGKEIWIQASYNPILDGNGNPFKVVKYATDITAQKLQSADFEGQLSAIGKSQAVIEFELDGTILTANENFTSTVGYSLAEIQGQHHRMFVEPEYSKSAEYAAFWQSLARGEYKAAEYKRIGKGGKEIWIQASYNPIFDLNGNPFKVVKYATDITAEVQQRVRNKQLAALGAMVAEMPTNVIMADKDLRITYANPASIKQLTALQQYLPVPVSELVGQNIDVFHKNPAYQRGMLANPDNLPHQAQIQVGPETLDLLVSAVKDADGNYLGPMVTWEVITEKLRTENEMVRVQNMMDNIPINVMMSNTDFEIVYMNPASYNTLKQIEHLLPAKTDEIVGQKIDIFHKNPEMQRRIVSDPSNLPHRAKIALGEETLDLLVSAITDKDGKFIGPMITWDVITAQVELANEFEREVKGVVQVVTSSATEMQASSKSMAATTEETSRQAQVVAAASEEATKNVETVSSAAEELSASISEIANHVQEASRMTSQAVEEADRTNVTINDLGESSNEIGQVVKVITSIAQQTNLLALNATIEAARAGEAGKGFAVVANEVKELARQTAKATEEISQKIAAIQSATGGAATAIESIGERISKINEIATTIAGAVEEQTAATNEISRNVAEAAKGTSEVSSNISSVSQAADEGGRGAADILAAADSLAQESSRLDETADQFLEKLRAV